MRRALIAPLFLFGCDSLFGEEPDPEPAPESAASVPSEAADPQAAPDEPKDDVPAAEADAPAAAVPAEGGCDLAAVAKLGEELGAAPARDRADMVWPRLRMACGFPTELRKMLDVYLPWDQPKADAPAPKADVPLATLADTACPGWGDSIAKRLAETPGTMRASTAFEVCKFARYDVVEAADATGMSSAIGTWAAHQWMKDQGVPAETLALFTRSLNALENAPLIGGLDDQTWPEATGEPLALGLTVYLSRSILMFNEKNLASVRDGKLDENSVKGHLISPLYDSLVEEVMLAKQMAKNRGEEWDGRLLIAADAGTTMETLVDLMYTAGRAEFSNYGIIVQAKSAYRPQQIPISPPKYDPRGEPDVSALMTVEFKENAITLSRSATPDAGEVTVTETPRTDLSAVAKYAADLKSLNTDAHRVVVGAETTASFQDVAATIAAARGAECGADGNGCALPDVILVAGPAHGYSPAPAVPVGGFGRYQLDEDPDDPWAGLTGSEVGEAYGVGGLGKVGDAAQGSTDEKSDEAPAVEGKVRQAKARVQGSLDKDIIRRIVRAHLAEVRSCYNDGLKDDAKLEGRVAINFVITPTGKVGSSVVQETSLKKRSVANCIAKAVKRWKFPKPRGGGNVIVTYPFTLSPG